MEYLATDEVVKIYNKKRVVNKVSIEVKRGEVV
jgi:ABC-type lipopolysaccharide export system ATPase subunit